MLEGKGLWVSRAARNRILALADTLKRKHKHIFHDTQNKKNWNTEVKNVFAIEGLDATFSTKAEMKRAWAKAHSKPATPALQSGSALPSRRPSEEHQLDLGEWPPNIDLLNADMSSVYTSEIIGQKAGSMSSSGVRPGTRHRPKKVLPLELLNTIADIERSVHCILKSDMTLISIWNVVSS